MTTDATAPDWWRRPLVALVRRRSSWATAYTRRQIRLADEDLAATEPLVDHVDAAADTVERTPLPRFGQRHHAVRRELFDVVRRAERRMARSGAYQLTAAGLVRDPAATAVIDYLATEVAPALDRVAGELAADAQRLPPARA